MPNSDLLPSVLFTINENQLALGAAIMELTLWDGQRGLVEVAGNVRGALQTIDENEDFIKMSLAVLMPPNDRNRPIADIWLSGKTSRKLALIL